MPLSAGTRLGSFLIETPLGAGGMGEVYKAKDTRLDRTVAIKILPSADPDSKARFEREAKAIAGLQHPHICALYDVGKADSTDFLVLEYLEGETLASRLNRATLKPEDALKIAIEIAEALNEAHRAGIVHRDLKPGNVMLTRSGVKLLDFGLAKLRPSAPAVSGLPNTETAPPITSQGTILGTLHYMAPEQVEGLDADARSDTFAFGCVLYEMLTGRQAFAGKTPASVIAAILEHQPPPISSVLPVAPPLADAIVRKCLAKNPADRWQSAADLASALRWAIDTPASTAVPTPPARRRLSAVAAAALVAIAALAAGLLFGWRYASSDVPPAPAVRFVVEPPAGAMLSPSPVASAAQLALSPDGQQLAFIAAAKGGASQIWIRRLESIQSQALPGTEGASFPFWSHDSRSLAFFAGGKLKRIDTRGGALQTISDAAAGRGGTWNRDDIIVFSGQANTPISKVSASGGTVTPVTTLAEGILTQYWPQFLPDGQHILYYQGGAKPELQGTFVTTLDSAPGRRVLNTSSRAVYGAGHLLFVREGILFAQPFDDRALTTTGDAVRIADDVGYYATAFAYTAVTAAATSVLAHGPNVVLATSLQWRDRSGANIGVPLAPRAYSSPRLSPDQTTVVVSITDVPTAQSDLWQVALARGTISRVTTDPLGDMFPTWSPDGSRVYFSSPRVGTQTIFQKVGNAPEEVLADDGLLTSVATYATDVTSDGRFLLYQQSTSRGYNLGVLSMAERKPSPFAEGAFNEVQGRFSPNGRWVAYASDESGKFDVYVRPFPADRSQSTMISIAGGMQPEWRRDGKELFYISADGKMTAVPVVTDGPVFTAGAPRALFDVATPESTAPYPSNYAVTADGQRFLINTTVEQPTRPALAVIFNWLSSLNK